MKNRLIWIGFLLLLFANLAAMAQTAKLRPEILKYEPFVWPSEIPEDCPFEQSDEYNGIQFLGIKSGYHYGDTWYPTWASNDTLYSPWTDGKTKRLDGYTDWSQSWVDPVHITTGQGIEPLRITGIIGSPARIPRENLFLEKRGYMVTL